MIAGRYEVGEVIGRGGMADVRAGFDERLQRPVAIKCLHPQMAGDPGIRTRFEAEARAAAGLTHPNAVAVYDVGEHEGVPYLVMERLPGETLADRLKSGPVDPEWMRRAAGDVLGALAAAHARGIVHRDVKPGNILITAEDCAKIADFGIAKSVQEGADPTGVITLTGQLLGTPAYLAPERLSGTAATPQSDLYSLGVVLYEALTGQRPFSGTTPIAMAQAIDSGVHPALAELRPDVAPELASAVERAMARQPEQRFADAADMAGALGVEPAGVTSLADATLSMAAPSTQVLSTEAMLAAPPAPQPDRQADVARRRAVAMALVAAIAALGVALALMSLRGGGNDGTPVRAQQPASTITTVPTTRAPVAVTSPPITEPQLTDPDAEIPLFTVPTLPFDQSGAPAPAPNGRKAGKAGKGARGDVADNG